MKKISELTDKEFRKIVASNKELRKKLFDRAYDGEQDYMSDKLCEVFFHEEFEPTLDWLEDFHYELYCGEVSDKSEGIIELLQDDLEDWLVDDSGKVYKPIAA